MWRVFCWWRVSPVGRSGRFGPQVEWRLSEPLQTKSLEAAKRRYVPKADAKYHSDASWRRLCPAHKWLTLLRLDSPEITIEKVCYFSLLRRRG